MSTRSGELNAIANLITNFFLAAFAITNFACFDSSAAKSPGFRPGFRYYNKWLSLFGAFLCVVAMFVLSWLTSLVTFLVLGVMFLFIKHNKARKFRQPSRPEIDGSLKMSTGELRRTRTATERLLTAC